ncbi:MAG TPA: decaprenyl-phosphate phosphoribosyltransferase [Solirubrobacterales bacterium]|jgi:4-hydroxybenzoate polyprenyltransferase|nr:decaprenyl-phosphate phosphoribosyltransferase [Solirubrobacterales bacterium]
MESLTGREDAVAERPTQDRAGSEHRPSTARALLAAMRPPEWIKNLLVYAGLLFSQQFDDPGRVLDATLAFVAFCAISSAGYLINDLRDVAFDRRHPEKRHRAIASGALSERLAWTAAVVLAAVAIGLSLAAVSAEVAGLVAAYGAITIAYSLILKRLVILDVMTIASLFILRVVAGAVAVDAQASEWLLLCTGMLALFLGFTKRRQEATEEMAENAETRPVLEHYSVPFLDQMVSMVTAAAIISYAIYAVNSPRIGSEMLATAPSVLYGIFRYLYLIYDRRDTRSTAAILTEDPGMIFAGVTWVGTALLMLYAFN